jgi:hypothetical protein
VLLETDLDMAGDFSAHLSSACALVSRRALLSVRVACAQLSLKTYILFGRRS